MKILLVAATSAEVQPIVDRLAGPSDLTPHRTRFTYLRHQIDVLVTGVGMVATAVWCAKAFAETRPDVALNVGVCGSFIASYPPGAVVQVISDRVTELGAEDGDAFLTIQDLGLLGDNESPYRAGRLVNTAPLSVLSHLPQVDGITVNTVHGNDASIARVVERCAPAVESMEGAAFMYACITADVPFAQVRAVSNRVERRNRANWRLAEAIASLTNEVTLAVEAL